MVRSLIDLSVFGWNLLVMRSYGSAIPLPGVFRVKGGLSINAGTLTLYVGR